MDSEEEFRDIPGWEGLYKAGSRGSIYSVRAERVMKPAIASSGYLRANLSRDGVTTYHYVHHLVMAAFVGPRPEKMVTMHLNENSMDNRVENLKYGTHQENIRAHWKINGHKRKPMVTRNCGTDTHCHRGHDRSEFTYVPPGGGNRSCRACMSIVSMELQDERRRALGVKPDPRKSPRAGRRIAALVEDRASDNYIPEGTTQMVAP